MEPAMAQARLRIKETLDARPELTVTLGANGSQSSRLRARFLSQDGDTISVQLAAALGQNLLVSIAGEIETSLRAPVPARQVPRVVLQNRRHRKISSRARARTRR